MLFLTSFVAICCLVTVLMSASLLPFLFFRKNAFSVRCLSSSLLSMCNCFACGVFLGTCFISLIPHTKMQEKLLMGLLYSNDISANSSDVKENAENFKIEKTLLDANLIILVGFLLMVLLEQLFLLCYSTNDKVQHNCHIMLSQAAPLDFNENDNDSNINLHSTMFKDAFYSKKNLNLSDDGIIKTKNKEDRRKKKESNIARLLLHSDSEPLVKLDDLLDDFSDTDKDSNESEETASIHFSSCHAANYNLKSNSVSTYSSSFRTLNLVMLLLAMSVHSIFEGIALGAQRDSNLFFKLLFSIMFHEVLCSFSFGISLSKQNVSLKSAFFSATLLSFSIPFGVFIMALLGITNGFLSLVLKFVLEGFAAGIFIYVACIQMLAPEFTHKKSTHSLEIAEENLQFDDKHNVRILPNQWHGVVKALVVCFGAFIAFFVKTWICST